MDYNATAVLGRPFARLRESDTDAILDRLSEYGPAINAGPTGHAEVVVTFPADALEQAIATARALLGPLRPIGLEVVPTEFWDKRAEAVPIPALLSVTEVAARLGISRQAVLQRIESGSLPARRVGNGWAIAERG